MVAVTWIVEYMDEVHSETDVLHKINDQDPGMARETLLSLDCRDVQSRARVDLSGDEVYV